MFSDVKRPGEEPVERGVSCWDKKVSGISDGARQESKEHSALVEGFTHPFYIYLIAKTVTRNEML